MIPQTLGLRMVVEDMGATQVVHIYSGGAHIFSFWAATRHPATASQVAHELVADALRPLFERTAAENQIEQYHKD